MTLTYSRESPNTLAGGSPAMRICLHSSCRWRHPDFDRGEKKHLGACAASAYLQDGVCSRQNASFSLGVQLWAKTKCTENILSGSQLQADKQLPSAVRRPCVVIRVPLFVVTHSGVSPVKNGTCWRYYRLTALWSPCPKDDILVAVIEPCANVATCGTCNRLSTSFRLPFTARSKEIL